MSNRRIYRGTTEYLTVEVSGDTTLSAQAVAVSFDRATWLTAAWTGSSGTTRNCQVLVSDANLPTGATSDVWVRITDTPEIPILRAGQVDIL